MKVAPASADMVADAPLLETGRDLATPGSVVPKTVSPRARRAEVN